MNLPSKKRVTRIVVALTVCMTIVVGCLGAGYSNEAEAALPSPTVAESQVTPMTMATSIAMATALNTVTEAVAAHASEEVEVVEEIPATELEPAIPTLDRTKPLYKVYKDGWEVSVSTELQWYIRDMCEKYNFPEKTIYGMILCESTFQADAYGAGCYGLCQINSFWIHGAAITHFTDDYSSRNLLNPYDNLLTLAEMTCYCRDTYGLDLSTRDGQIKWLYWHNTGRDPRNVSHWAYAEKALRFADELVPLQ